MSEDSSNIIEQLPSVLFRTDKDGTLTWWNSAAARKLLSISEKKPEIGDSILDKSFLWANEKIREGLRSCTETKDKTPIDDVPYHSEQEGDGFLAFNLYPAMGGHGEIDTVLWFGADITARIQMETQLQQAQKLEAVGQLATGVAHEINTPTQYVSDNLRFIRDSFQDHDGIVVLFLELLEMVKKKDYDACVEQADKIESAMEAVDLPYLREEVPQALQQSLEGTAHITKIVSAMKEFAHPNVEDKTDCDINHLIETSLTVSSNEWKYVADLVTELQSLPRIPCIPGLLNQVFLNLIVNAAHAMADKAGKTDPQKKGTLRIVTQLKEDNVDITIADNGGGIPEEIRQRIFDPFFTTKEPGRGTGQGLAIAHAVIVEKHGGTIRVDSTVGQGTSFTLSLPID